MKCPKCGSNHTEEHGTEPGDYNWYFCRECGENWPTDKQKEVDDAFKEEGERWFEWPEREVET